MRTAAVADVHVLHHNVTIATRAFATFALADAVLAARATVFSLVNFKVVFALAYARICVTLLQAVVAFHDLQTREPSAERLMETFIVLFAGVNIVVCDSVRMLDSDNILE